MEWMGDDWIVKCNGIGIVKNHDDILRLGGSHKNVNSGLLDENFKLVCTSSRRHVITIKRPRPNQKKRKKRA